MRSFDIMLNNIPFLMKMKSGFLFSFLSPGVIKISIKKNLMDKTEFRSSYLMKNPKS